ncbi:hypothetical protein MRY87_04875 [bacterium]|nr:hypothetical protein [bacterium]
MFLISWTILVSLSALLFFTIQPMIAKLLLPSFGGGASVWIVSLLFFQVVLFLGYGYSYLLSHVRPLRIQSWIHLAVLLFTFFWIPVHPIFETRVGVHLHHSPTKELVRLLVTSLFGPVLILAATGPILQYWWSRLHTTPGAYRFYALSNIASLLGLLLYPLLIERTLTLHTQFTLWSLLYLLFVSVFILTLMTCVRFQGAENTRNRKYSPLQLQKKFIAWILLPAVGTAILMSITRVITTDIAPAPLLWVLPLALYLGTFSIAFSRERFHLSTGMRISYTTFLLLLPCSLMQTLQTSTWQELFIALGSLFSFCSLLHGELSRSKPEKEYLPLFYLCIALGGSLGGSFAAIGSPLLLSTTLELFLLLLIIVFVFFQSLRVHAPSRLIRTALSLTLCTGLFLTTVLAWSNHFTTVQLLSSSRNFYGELLVKEKALPEGRTLRTLFHGSMEHGAQLISNKREREPFPTSYYSPMSGIGLLFEHFDRRFPRSRRGSSREEKLPTTPPLKVIAIGMGVGAVSSYLHSGDILRYYEINPAVVDIAREYFSYLSSSPGEEQVMVSDGRLGLEQALRNRGPLHADILILDAFNSDSIPTHLLTAEAFALYRKHIQADGVIAVLYDSDYSNLLPILQGHARANDLMLFDVYSQQDSSNGIREVSWAMISSRTQLLEDENFKDTRTTLPEDPVIWTDEFSPTWAAIDWR